MTPFKLDDNHSRSIIISIKNLCRTIDSLGIYSIKLRQQKHEALFELIREHALVQFTTKKVTETLPIDAKDTMELVDRIYAFSDRCLTQYGPGKMSIRLYKTTYSKTMIYHSRRDCWMYAHDQGTDMDKVYNELYTALGLSPRPTGYDAHAHYNSLNAVTRKLLDSDSVFDLRLDAHVMRQYVDGDTTTLVKDKVDSREYFSCTRSSIGDYTLALMNMHWLMGTGSNIKEVAFDIYIDGTLTFVQFVASLTDDRGHTQWFSRATRA